jgi:hypothetical protein
VLAIKPVGFGSAQEELTSVGIGTGVGHTQDSSTSVLQLEVLVGELGSVDGFSTSTVVVGEVTACDRNRMGKEREEVLVSSWGSTKIPISNR